MINKINSGRNGINPKLVRNGGKMEKHSYDIKNVTMLSLCNLILLGRVRTRSLLHNTTRMSEILQIMVYEFQSPSMRIVLILIEN